MKTNKIHIDIFDFDIHIYVWEKWLWKLFYNSVYWKDVEYVELNDDCDWVCVYADVFRDVLVWVFDNNQSTMIHEINHAIQRMLYKMDIPMWVDNTELVSNLWEYILPKALDILNNKKKKWKRFITAKKKK